MQYRLPIDFYGFFQRIELSSNKKGTRFRPEFDQLPDVKHSIDQFIELLVFTHPGECRFAHDFGFIFWDNQFNNISIEAFNSTENPRKIYENSLRDTIMMYEERLDKVSVEITLSDLNTVVNKMRIKFFVTISIQGIIKGLQPRPYNKNIVFTIGPVVRK